MGENAVEQCKLEVPRLLLSLIPRPVHARVTDDSGYPPQIVQKIWSKHCDVYS